MATVVISVQQKGAKTVKRDIAGIGEASKKSGGAVNVLRRALAALGGALAIRKVVQTADAYTNLQNRLKLVTNGTNQLEAVTERLFRTAQDTRNAFSATADFYARTALAAKDLGKSQSDLLTFTELTNKAIATSGANAEASANGLIQLAQGISSNRLQGDELRSVLENIPAVADSIARGLDTTRGELRRLAAEGFLTGKRIIEAIISDGDTINKNFEDVNITIGQSIIKISNAFIKLIGSFKGATGAVSGSLSFIADNFDLIAKAAVVASVAIITKFIPAIGVKLLLAVGLNTRALGLLRIAMFATFSGNLVKAIRAVRLAIVSLNTAVAANPIGLIVIAVASAIAALTLFKDNIIVIKDESITLGDILFGVWSLVKDSIALAFSIANTAFAGFSFAMNNLVINPISKLIDKLSFLGDVFSSVFNFMVKVSTKAIDFILKGLEELINAPIRALNALSEITGGDLLEEVDVTSGIKSFSDNLINGLLQVTTNVRDVVLNASSSVLDKARERSAIRNVPAPDGDLEKEGEDLLAKAARLDFFKKLEQGFTNEISLTKLLSKEREIEIELRKILLSAAEKGITLTATEIANIKSNITVLQEKTEKMGVLDSIYEDIKSPQKDFASGVEALDTLLKDGSIGLEEYSKKFRILRIDLLDQNNDLASGAERALLKIDDRVNDLASTVEDTLVNSFKAAEDALVQFVATGKLDFNSLINSIVADITRLAVQQAIMQPLLGAVGGGGGLFSSLSGLFGGGTSVPGMQHGGSFNVGGTGGTDSQLVAFKATPGENVTVNASGESSGPGSGITVLNNFYISTQDAESFSNEQTQQQIQQQLIQSSQRAFDRNS